MVVSTTLLLLTLSLYFSYSSSSSGYIVIAGGRDDNNFFSQVLALNVDTGDWQEIGASPHDCTGTTLTSDGDQNLYVFAGSYATDFSHKYHFDLNQWVPITPLATLTGHGASAVMVDGSIFLIGGWDDPTGNWELTCDFAWHKRASDPHGHVFNGAAVLNSYIYVCGPGCDDNTPSRYCDKYSISTDTWSPSTEMISARARFSLVVLNGYIYAIGGTPGDNERFDPKTGQWSPIQAMLETRYSPGVATDGTNIYAIGGLSSTDAGSATYFSVAEVYIVELNVWQRVAELPFPRGETSAAFVRSLKPAMARTRNLSRKPRFNATIEDP